MLLITIGGYLFGGEFLMEYTLCYWNRFW